jgi:hypothetical protein
MAEPTLYLVFLGGDLAPGRMGEDHEVVVVVADDVKSARAAARKKWTGTSRPHVDAIRPLIATDGYSIQLVHTGAADALEIDTTFEP